MIDNESIENLKQRIDIVDVVGSYLELRKAGANFKAICPFHNDTSPSMHVSPSKQIYHCFVCGAGGDGIKFVMEHEKLTYPEAIERIASMYNFTLVYKATDGKKRSEKKILESLNTFFKECLKDNTAAQEYLKSRGITQDFIDRFEIGYAPSSHLTLNFLKRQSITTKESIEVGAVGIGENNNEYSRFIERITFPIYSPSNKVVGFGGRTISGHPAKYINSPQSSIFNKSRLLYGYNVAREHIAKKRRIIVCEGYLDVIMLHLAGFNEAVATLGTALTNEHIPLLLRASPKVILSYDGDGPGIDAALKAAKLLSRHNIEGGVVLFGEGMDPADMVQNGYIDKLNELYNNPKDLIEFTLERTVKKFDLTTPFLRQKALEEALSYLKTLPHTLSQSYVGMLANMVGIKSGLIHLGTKKPIKNSQPTKAFEDTLELSIIKTLLITPSLFDEVLNIVDATMFKVHKDEFNKLLENKNDDPSLRSLLLREDIQTVDDSNLITTLIPLVIVFYEEKLEEIKNSTTLSFEKKIFYLRKIRDNITTLKKGELVPYESISTF